MPLGSHRSDQYLFIRRVHCVVCLRSFVRSVFSLLHRLHHIACISPIALHWLRYIICDAVAAAHQLGRSSCSTSAGTRGRHCIRLHRSTIIIFPAIPTIPTIPTIRTNPTISSITITGIDSPPSPVIGIVILPLSSSNDQYEGSTVVVMHGRHRYCLPYHPTCWFGATRMFPVHVLLLESQLSSRLFRRNQS